jgi:hypothetical protein
MGIDEARENKFPGSVDNFCAGRRFEIFSDAGDGVAFGVDVGVRARPRRNDFSIAD